MAELSVDIVVFEGETVEDAARSVAGQWAGEVSWSVGPSGNCHPEVTYHGDQRSLDKIKMRYHTLGKNTGLNKGKPPAKKGEKR